MPAPDLQTLFRFEEAIERAIVAVLVANGISAFRQRDRAVAKSPCVWVKLHGAGVTGHRGQYAPGKMMCDAWNGQLVLSVATNRADPSQASVDAPAAGAAVNTDHGPDTHALILGKLRVLMLYASAQFTSANLPFHYLEQIQDAGVAPRVDNDRDLDISPLLYKIVFGIRADAWPLPPAP